MKNKLVLGISLLIGFLLGYSLLYFISYDDGYRMFHIAKDNEFPIQYIDFFSEMTSENAIDYAMQSGASVLVLDERSYGLDAYAYFGSQEVINTFPFIKEMPKDVFNELDTRVSKSKLQIVGDDYTLTPLKIRTSLIPRMMIMGTPEQIQQYLNLLQLQEVEYVESFMPFLTFNQDPFWITGFKMFYDQSIVFKQDFYKFNIIYLLFFIVTILVYIAQEQYNSIVLMFQGISKKRVAFQQTGIMLLKMMGMIYLGSLIFLIINGMFKLQAIVLFIYLLLPIFVLSILLYGIHILYLFMINWIKGLKEHNTAIVFIPLLIIKVIVILVVSIPFSKGALSIKELQVITSIQETQERLYQNVYRLESLQSNYVYEHNASIYESLNEEVSLLYLGKFYTQTEDLSRYILYYNLNYLEWLEIDPIEKIYISPSLYPQVYEELTQPNSWLCTAYLSDCSLDVEILDQTIYPLNFDSSMFDLFSNFILVPKTNLEYVNQFYVYSNDATKMKEKIDSLYPNLFEYRNILSETKTAIDHYRQQVIDAIIQCGIFIGCFLLVLLFIYFSLFEGIKYKLSIYYLNGVKPYVQLSWYYMFRVF